MQLQASFAPDTCLLTICLPKGHNAKQPILKHCNPAGIPIIVIHKINPGMHQSKQTKKPPKITHIKLQQQFASCIF